MDQAAHQALAQAAGKENYTRETGARILYGGDATGRLHPPEAVVRARDTAQISRVLAACTAHGAPVVPRGAGTGLTGGALPVAGGVVLDMCGMDRILSIDPQDQVAVAQPGVITADLQAAAQAQGLFYPPDPASVGSSTLGGNLAENSGGLKAVKYGVTRDYVLGIKAVLADGRVFATGSRTIKSVVGYDLTRLLVGSEGTLAVLVEMTLRLKPQPESSQTLSALYNDLDQACAGIAAVLGSGVIPVACEFMDAASLKAVDQFAGLGLGSKWQAMLLLDLDGPPEVVERQAGQVADILEKSGAGSVRRAREAKEVQSLWLARRSMGPAIYQLAPNKLNEDVAVPLGRLGEMVRRVQEVSQKRGLAIPVFGHAGDGNLHINIMYHSDDPIETRAAQEAVSDIFAHTLALGGTLSGEHGVGVTKLGYVGAETDPVALELMRGIKRVFDPAGILNPHKKLPPI